MRGTIRTYVTDRGFGFVRPDNGDDDLFFHISDVIDAETWRIAAGTAVTFDVGSSPKDRGRFGSHRQREVIMGIDQVSQ